jgi:hypothetical protein
MAVRNVKELLVYEKSYQQAMRFFEISKRFPAEDRKDARGHNQESGDVLADS